MPNSLRSRLDHRPRALEMFSIPSAHVSAHQDYLTEQPRS
jgi:hypothetical protein